MNKKQKEFLDKCIKTNIADKLPLFDYIYIIQENKKHESGFKILNICGYNIEQDKYYLIDTMSDILDLETFKDIHIDCKENGIIRIFSDHKRFKSIWRVSSCSFEMVD